MDRATDVLTLAMVHRAKASGRAVQSSTNSQLGDLEPPDVDERTLVDLKAGGEHVAGRWSLSGWGRNVTDGCYWESANTSHNTIVSYAGLSAT